MRHVKICSLVTLAVIALLLAVAHCGAEAQSPLPTWSSPRGGGGCGIGDRDE
jgi:hypothetical protein